MLECDYFTKPCMGKEIINFKSTCTINSFTINEGEIDLRHLFAILVIRVIM